MGQLWVNFVNFKDIRKGHKTEKTHFLYVLLLLQTVPCPGGKETCCKSFAFATTTFAPFRGLKRGSDSKPLHVVSVSRVQNCCQHENLDLPSNLCNFEISQENFLHKKSKIFCISIACYERSLWTTLRIFFFCNSEIIRQTFLYVIKLREFSSSFFFVYNLRHGNYLNRETKKVYRVKLIYLISFLSLSLSQLRCELIPLFALIPPLPLSKLLIFLSTKNT